MTPRLLEENPNEEGHDELEELGADEESDEPDRESLLSDENAMPLPAAMLEEEGNGTCIKKNPA